MLHTGHPDAKVTAIAHFYNYVKNAVKYSGIKDQNEIHRSSWESVALIKFSKKTKKNAIKISDKFWEKTLKVIKLQRKQERIYLNGKGWLNRRFGAKTIGLSDLAYAYIFITLHVLYAYKIQHISKHVIIMIVSKGNKKDENVNKFFTKRGICAQAKILCMKRKKFGSYET